MKQQRRAHFHVQLREPEGQADAGRLPLIQAIIGLQGFAPPCRRPNQLSCRFVGSFLDEQERTNDSSNI
jgi:hypothetical protein